MSNGLKAANMLARAATDPEFRERLKSDPVATSQSVGVSLHDHAGYRVLEDTGGMKNIVVTEAIHGQADGSELPAEPSISEVRRWAIFHVHAGDSQGEAIKSDINAAILAAGARPPADLRFNLVVDNPDIMHMVIPYADSSEIGLAEAEMFAAGGTTIEAAAAETTVIQTAEISTTEVVQEETTVEAAAEVAVAAVEVEVTCSSTTVVVEVEVAIVPGFLT